MRPTTCAVLMCLPAITAAAQDAGPTVSSEGAWDLKRSIDGRTCVLMPRTQSRIRIAGDRVEVTGLPIKSIFNYQYRIDDDAASSIIFPSAEMQNAGVISLGSDVLEKALGARRFRIRILDTWHEAITEDVSLAGLQSLHQRMKRDCT